MKMTRVLLLILSLSVLFTELVAADTAPNPEVSQTPQIASAVPVNSWQYNAVLRLYNDGISGGLADSDLNGDRVFTRLQIAKFIHYAQAQVKKDPKLAADTDIKLLNKLADYYAADLKTLGLEYSRLEAVSSESELLALMNDKFWFPKFSFFAEADMDTHFSQNPASNSANASAINVNAYPGTFFPDLYMQMQINGRVSESWFYYTELRFDPGGVDVSTNGLTVVPALRQLMAYGPLYGVTTYSNADATGAPQGGQPAQNYFGQPFGVTAYIGRMADQLPFNDNTGNQGIVNDNHMTGFRLALTKNSWSGDVFGGYEDSQFSTYSGYGTVSNPLNAFMTGADIGYQVSENTQLYGGYYQFWGYDNSSKAWAAAAPLQFLEVGVEQAFNSLTQLTVYASGSPNYNINTLSPYAPAGSSSMYETDWTDNAGVLARLSYGTYSQTEPGSVTVYGQGSCIGAGAIWGSSDSNAANYDNEVYQPNRALGAVGYELGMNWAPIHNTDLLLSFSQTWPKNTPAPGSQWLSNTDDSVTLYDTNTNLPYNVLKVEMSYFF